MVEQPDFGKNSFTCPYCGAFAHQLWSILHPRGIDVATVQVLYEPIPSIVSTGPIAVSGIVKGAAASECAHCKQVSLWVGGELRWPPASLAPPAHLEMPAEIRSDYEEAAEILQNSPRGACALLRLCIQELFSHLGAGDNINNAIAKYAKGGLNPQLVAAMDILRVVGNNAVHPGEMDLRDDRETAGQLFELINEIVDELVSRPARTARLYAKLPEGAREAIKARDSAK